MYRLISASQDAYIQDKLIKNVRCTDANTGQAGTIDLYSLYNETYIPSVSGTFTTSSVKELSRGLIKFDYEELQQLTSSILNLNDSSFKVYLSMIDVYGGQTVPSNYTLMLFPLAKEWNEGRGSDVISYRQLDVVNFLTASVLNENYVTWSLSGANSYGPLSSGSNVDIWVSGNINGITNQYLGVSQTFKRGDENLWLDITHLVSASIVGTLPNNGFRLSYTQEEEDAEQTFFVKRFGTRHVYNQDLKPLLHVQYSGDLIEDQTQLSYFGNGIQNFFTYKKNSSGNYTNFVSGNTSVSGSNCLLLELAASHSIQYQTSSWSISHSASITYLTKSFDTFKAYFTGSQYSIGNIAQTGIYNCIIEMNPETTQSLSNFLSGATEHTFKVSWKSLDNSITYASTYDTFQFNYGSFSNVNERNITVNITNLRYEYQSGDKIRLRIFVQDYDSDMLDYKTPKKSKSSIIPNMYWRIRKAYENIIVIPWNTDATKLSYDNEGMYFDLWTSDFDINIIYQIDFLIQSDSTGKDLYIENPGFRFKVVE